MWTMNEPTATLKTEIPTGPAPARITFPAPTADWGKPIAATIPNPAWRWWTFWRPRTITIDLR